MKHVEVVAAVIFKDNRVFCAQRKDAGEIACKWEFPGGKIEKYESHQEALIREIHEELRADIVVGDFITTVNHQYNTFSITMHAYEATIVKGEVTLTEHLSSKWLTCNEIDSVEWAAADIPIAKIVSGMIR